MNRPNLEQSFKHITLCDHMGNPIEAPKVGEMLSAKQLRKYYLKGPARVGAYDSNGKSGDIIREEIVRAQVPYVVSILMYRSKFEIEPTRREYCVYAPMEIQKAAEVAIRMWQRWEGPRQSDQLKFGDMNDLYPKFEDGVVAEPIDDASYDAHWADVRRRKHRCAGNPDDPFVFTCTDQDVMLFKTADFQTGLHTRIT